MNDGAEVRTSERVVLALLLVLSFPIAIITYNHLGEDAYISFRYARNLAEGHGLVFNIGEREEGYSNLLWVIVLALFEKLGARMDVAARVLSTLALVATAALAWQCARRTLGDAGSALARFWLAAAVCYQPLLRYHADRGLETMPIACTVAAGLFLIAMRAPLWLAGIAGGATTLLRPEGIGFALCLVPAAFLAADGAMRARAVAAAKYAAIPLACFAGQMLFRKLYYDAWLPNTVIAKRHGEGGAAWELATWVASSAFMPVLAVMGAALALRDPRTRVLGAGTLCVFFACIVFQAISGKLINEGWRYIAPAFLATVIGCWLLLVQVGLGILSKAHRGTGVPPVLVAGLLLLANLTLLCQTPAPAKTRLLEGNRDALRSRFHIRILEFFRHPDFGFHWEWFFHQELFLNAEAGKWVRANLPADAFIAGDQLGQLGYYSATTQRYLDLLGLMDRRIAKEGAKPSEILARNPDYFVVLCFADSDFWPKELRGLPIVPTVRDLFSDQEIRGRWHRTIILQPRENLSHCNFTVYEKTPEKIPPRTVEIGVTTEEFDRWWRVL